MRQSGSRGFQNVKNYADNKRKCLFLGSVRENTVTSRAMLPSSKRSESTGVKSRCEVPPDQIASWSLSLSLSHGLVRLLVRLFQGYCFRPRFFSASQVRIVFFHPLAPETCPVRRATLRLPQRMWLPPLGLLGKFPNRNGYSLFDYL